MPRFVISADLGKEKDYAVFGITEQVIKATRPPSIPSDVYGFTPGAKPSEVYHLRYLERFPLSTNYESIAIMAKELYFNPALERDVRFVFDATGVGSAVGEHFYKHGLDPVAITITGGETSRRVHRGWHVPKVELVTTLQLLFNTERLQIVKARRGSELEKEIVELRKQLDHFVPKTRAGKTKISYEAATAFHDDYVMMLALAAWYHSNNSLLAQVAAQAEQRSQGEFFDDLTYGLTE